MKQALFLVAALLLIGAGCSTTSNTTIDTTVPPAQTGTGTDVDNDSDDTSTTGVNVDTNVDVGVDVGLEDKVVEFTITGKNMSFDPKEIKVKKGDKVRITFINAEGFHDWKLEEYNVGTKQISAGSTEVVEFVADKAGSFEYYCSVGSHRKMGMWGTLTVE